MKKVMISLVVVLALCGVSRAAEIVTPEAGFPERTPQISRDICALQYANFCSGWVYTWTGYKGAEFAELPFLQRPPAKIGVCFDLDDCSLGCENCVELEGLSWAWKRFTSYGRIDVEIYCADEDCCPVGPPVAGIYDFHVEEATAWQNLPFGALELPCETCKFIAMATVKTPADCVPYSDANDKNVDNGCEPAWRCSGHSFVYRCMTDYCGVLGTPDPLRLDAYGVCSPDDAFACEWICFAYISCEESVATEQSTWSQIKSFYR